MSRKITSSATRKGGGGGGGGGKFVHCIGAVPDFDPETYIKDAARQEQARKLLAEKNDLFSAINLSFNIDPRRDAYVYHAMTSVRLAQVQAVVNMGRENGLHAWYRDDEGKPIDPPTQADIEAYVQIFLPTTQTTSALKSFLSNAKKSSLRADVAAHLTATRHIHPSLAATLAVPRYKKASSAPPNPYLDFWAWSCRALEWCGPRALSLPPSSSSSSSSSSVAQKHQHRGKHTQQSHHVLPILMHHFGCAAPTHEALTILTRLAAGRAIADMGSGNGYWAFMLRHACSAQPVVVHAVDNKQSEWRVNWIDDTEVADGVSWLRARDGGRDMVLLLVYPVVGLPAPAAPAAVVTENSSSSSGAAASPPPPPPPSSSSSSSAGGGGGAFTRSLVDAYRGDTLAVVGTQNANGYTGFRDMTMDQYVEREQPRGMWTKVAQVPLPSFAGKDEALFVFQRGPRAPPPLTGDGDVPAAAVATGGEGDDANKAE